MLHQIQHLFEYHKYWLCRDSGIRNPAFTPESGKLLDLKDDNPTIQARGIAHFSRLLRRYIPNSGLPLEQLKIYVVVVPSSTAGKWREGMCRVVDDLCKSHRHFVNLSKALHRHTTIEKLTLGGDRQIDVHFRTIDLLPRYRDTLKSKTVLLIDDVTTSGNSLRACGSILLQYGVAQVYPLALGRTYDQS